MLPQRNPIHNQRLDLLEHKHHPRPLVTGIDPLVNRPALDRDVSALHVAVLARVQQQLHLAIEDDGVVDAHGPVHDRLARREVDEPEDAASLDGEPWSLGQVWRVDADVLVVLEIDGILVGDIAQEEVVDPELGSDERIREAGFEYRHASLVVAGDESIRDAKLVGSHDE